MYFRLPISFFTRHSVFAALAMAISLILASWWLIPWEKTKGKGEIQLQSGRANVPGRDASPRGVDVYYAEPFTSSPHLTFPLGLDNKCVIDMQAKDHFRIKNTSNYEVLIFWEARGLHD